MTISGSSFIDNSATFGSAIYFGGGSALTISDSSFSGNYGSMGGAIISWEPLTISGSSFSSNSAGAGGAIYALDALTISDSSFSSNGRGRGAAIFAKDALTVSNSSFSGNTGSQGGAIYAGDSSSATISNSSFSRNSAVTAGGAIYAEAGTLTLSHVTIADGYSAAGNGIYLAGGTLKLRNSLIKDRGAGHACKLAPAATMSENVGNLISDDSCSPALSGDPRLGDFHSDGYYPLQSDSPAVNAAAQLTPSPSPTAINTLPPGATHTPAATPSPGPISLGNGCTLADAITAANTDTATGACPAGSGADTIVFTADVTLSANTPQINSDITFNGNNYTLDGAGSYQLFNISVAAVTVAINNLTLKNGVEAIVAHSGSLTINDSSFSDNSTNSRWSAAAIYTEGSLTINNSSFKNNSATGGPNYYHVGAIRAEDDSTLTISNSSFSGNEGSFAGTISISVDSTVTISDSSFSDSNGVAIQSWGNLTISGSSFSGNSHYLGGAIWPVQGTLTVSNSSFSNNSATGQQGGAIYASTSGSVTISNSSFSDNSAYRQGGAIYSRRGTLTLNHVTIADNSAPAGNGIYLKDSTLKLRNSLIKDNGDGDACELATAATMSENVGNLISDGSCSAALSGDPKLGAYSNGYYPLQSDSPAVNAADSTHCLSADQIGTSRPQGSACDIGAFEVPAAQLTATATATPTATETPTMTPTATHTPTATPTPQPISLGGDCTLHDAIIAANTDTATGGCPAGNGDDTIVFTADVTLSANAPAVTSNIAFSGNNYTLDGAGSYRLFYISEAAVTVSVNNLTLKNGSSHLGGAIYASGTLTISNSSFSDNSATHIYGFGYGGAIYASGALTISNSSFSDNFATTHGGAIVVDGGSVTISNSTLSNNSASQGRGGAIFQQSASSVLTLSHVTIADNSARQGNGIYLYSGVLKMRNSLLKDNGAGDACELGTAATSSPTVSENVGNLISDGSCSPAFSGDPKLGAYSNGYYPLQSDSPAINAADATHCLSADQIGTSRPQGSACDIGAFEVSSAQLTATATATPTATETPTMTPTATDTPSPAPTNTPTATATDTPSPAPSNTPTATATPDGAIILGNGCTLPDAIIAANTDTATGSCSAGSGADTIVFTANVTLSAHSPVITSDITFKGNNYTLDGAGSYRLFSVSDATLTVAINNLTLKNSTGAIVAYGGSITISDSSFSDNSAYDGAAIYTEGSVTISDSSFNNNFATRAGGAIYAFTGSLTISGSSFSDNSVMSHGGAIAVSSGSITISGSSFHNNSSSDGGGGALYASGMTLSISNSSFSANSTLNDGGAIYLWDADSTLTLTHVTIAGNSALQGNAIYNNGSSVNMRNSLLKDNGGGNACYTVGALNQNVGNLISDGSCSAALSGDPKLGAYSNGYYPLLGDSPAINAADSNHCLSVDQLGTARPQGSACDIGAYELPAAQISPPPPPTNTPVPTDTPVPGIVEISMAHGEAKTIDLAQLGSGLSWSATIKTWHVGAGEVRSGNLGARARNKLDGSISGATMSLQAGSSGAHILRLYVTGAGNGATVEQEYKVNVGPVDENTIDPGTGSPAPTATNTPVPTATNTPVPTATNTPVPTATNTPVPTATNTPVPTATNTPVPTATNTPVPTATNTPVPTATDTPIPVPTDTPEPTATNTPIPVPTDTPVPTATDTPMPIPTDTPVPTATDTPIPIPTDTPEPTATDTPIPVPTDTPVPTDSPAPGLIEFSMAHGEAKTVDLAELGSGLSWSATIKTWHLGAGECRSGDLGARARNKLNGSISGATMSLQAGSSGAHILRLYVTGAGNGAPVEQEYKVNVGPVDDSTVDPDDC